jgi:replication fork clamp-binding protein CrfC
MARSKFTFEKRQRERARQQKQQEKTTRRREAKQQKTEIDPEIRIEDSGIAGTEADPQALAENRHHVEHGEEGPRPGDIDSTQEGKT